MKGLKLIFLVITFGFTSICSAMDINVVKGKKLFSDPKLGGGSTGVSCNSCHPDGEGIKLGSDLDKTKNIINHCITKDMKGTGLDPNSEEIYNLIAYMQEVGEIDESWKKDQALLDCLE